MPRTHANFTKRLTTLEGTLTPKLNPWQQGAYAYATKVLGPSWAQRLVPAIQRGNWRDVEDVCYLVATSGASPRAVERELTRIRPLDDKPRHCPDVVAVLLEWLRTPAGQTRPVDPWWYWTHHVPEYEQPLFKQAVGHAALLADHQDPATWDSLPADQQDDLATCGLAWLVAARYPEVDPEAADVRPYHAAWSDVLEDCHRQWLHWYVETIPAATRRPRPAVAAPSERWAREIQDAADLEPTCRGHAGCCDSLSNAPSSR